MGYVLYLSPLFCFLNKKLCYTSVTDLLSLNLERRKVDEKRIDT